MGMGRIPGGGWTEPARQACTVMVSGAGGRSAGCWGCFDDHQAGRSHQLADSLAAKAAYMAQRCRLSYLTDVATHRCRYKGEVTTLRNLSGLRHVDAHTMSVSPDGTELVISLLRSLTLDASYMVSDPESSPSLAQTRSSEGMSSHAGRLTEGARCNESLPEQTAYDGTWQDGGLMCRQSRVCSPPQVVGRVQQGQEVLQQILDLGTDAHDAPNARVTITACGMANAKGAALLCGERTCSSALLSHDALSACVRCKILAEIASWCEVLSALAKALAVEQLELALPSTCQRRSSCCTGVKAGTDGTDAHRPVCPQVSWRRTP